MAKYIDVVKDIELAFARHLILDSEATPPDIVTVYPSNFQGGTFAEEFLKIEVLPGRPISYYSGSGVGGQIIIQIYTRAGYGTRRTMAIADAIDSVLQDKNLSRGTQTGTSSLTFLGIDPDDNSLFRADYSVQFRNWQ